jgi:hypothetical protein
VALGIHMRKVTPLYPKRVFMQWDLEDPTEDGSYTFKVERSAGTEGPWEVLIAGAQNIYNYIDDFGVQPAIPDEGKPHLHGLSVNPYYRVTVIPPSGCANSARTEPHGLEPELDPVARGLRRRLRYDEGIVFKRLNGVRLALLKRRTWGERCPDCYDAVTRATTREQCMTCYGTSFVGGYWAPVIVWGRVNTPKKTEVEYTSAPRTTREAATHVITLLDIPLLQDNDVIIETATNDRHMVRSQVRTELRRRSVHQQVTTSLMERGSVEYRIPVDLRAVPPLL